MDTPRLLPWAKAAAAWTLPLTQSRAQIKDECSGQSASPYASMACTRTSLQATALTADIRASFRALTLYYISAHGKLNYECKRKDSLTLLASRKSVKMTLQLRCDRTLCRLDLWKRHRPHCQPHHVADQLPSLLDLTAAFTVRRRKEWRVVNMSGDVPPRHVSVLVVHLEIF